MLCSVLHYETTLFDTDHVLRHISIIRSFKAVPAYVMPCKWGKALGATIDHWK
jgi:hypothetical protein